MTTLAKLENSLRSDGLKQVPKHITSEAKVMQEKLKAIKETAEKNIDGSKKLVDKDKNLLEVFEKDLAAAQISQQVLADFLNTIMKHARA